MSEPVFFKAPGEFRAWLEEHHETETELAVGFYKKSSGRASMTWSEAVDQALCFGWIDGRIDSIDAESYMHRFTPRKPSSNWSRLNIAKVERLKEAGLMRPAGLRAYEARLEGRSGIYAFEREEPAELPRAYERRLRANRAAWRYWRARPPSYRRTATHWVVSAKREETRERRLAQLIECSEEGRHAPPFIPRRGKG